MTISAEDAIATLRFVLPGFVLLSVFYWFGLATRRTDWRWLLWSLLASVPLAWAASATAEVFGSKSVDLARTVAECGADLLARSPEPAAFRDGLEGCVTGGLTQHNQGLQLLLAVALAIITGFAGVWIWRRVASAIPVLRQKAEPLAWGSVLRQQRWLKVYLEKETYIGYTLQVADPVEVEAGDLDIYIGEPQVAKPGGAFERVPNVEGVLLKREDIERIEVFEPQGNDNAGNEGHVHLTVGERLQGWISATRAGGS